jgi:hypothetical protein
VLSQIILSIDRNAVWQIEPSRRTRAIPVSTLIFISRSLPVSDLVQGVVH